MRHLTVSILVTVAVLLGSAGESFALPECPGTYNKTTWTNCFGTYTFDDGEKYVGEYKDGKYHGQGTHTFGSKSKWARDKYIGEFKDGKYHGQGTYTFASGYKYVGEFKDSKRHGQGTYTFSAPHKRAGEKYVGEWKDSKRNGQGTGTWSAPHKDAGVKYVGEYRNGKRNGQGTYTFSAPHKRAGEKYVGEWKDSKRNGQGTYTFPSGSKNASCCKQVGEWKNDLPNGQGVHTYADGRIEEGIFKDGRFQYAQKVTPPVIARKSSPPSPSTAEIENERLRRENTRLKEEKQQKPKPAKRVAKKTKPKVDQKKRLELARRTQEALEVLGLYSGKPDGIIGVKTKSAIQRWQKRNGYSGTGEVTELQLAKLEKEAITHLAKKKSEPKVAKKKTPKPFPPSKTATSGSGFFVSKSGHVITNQHIVSDCGKVTVGDNAKKQVTANVLETDRRNDLALLKISSMQMASAETKSLIRKLGITVVSLASHGLLRSEDVELGERVLVAGYPYGDIFSNTIKVTGGMVSANRGLGDDTGQFQMDAAVQPGNSGGPIYDENGNIVGVVVAQLNKMKFAKAIGSIPENVNFGIKASTVRQFLTSSGLPTKWSKRSKSMSTRELAKIAKNQTVMVVCHR